MQSSSTFDFRYNNNKLHVVLDIILDNIVNCHAVHFLAYIGYDTASPQQPSDVRRASLNYRSKADDIFTRHARN